MECHFDALPCTPFCLFEAFPLKGKRGIWREKQASHILHIPFRCIPPLVPYGTTLPGGKHVTGFSVAYGSLRIQFLCHPRKRGHYKAPLCCERLMKGLFCGVLFCPLHRGKSGAAG